MFQAARDAFGTLDILVNNAGFLDAPFLEMTLEQWNRVLEINLTGAFLCARDGCPGVLPGAAFARSAPV